jgi:hypothetical protein
MNAQQPPPPPNHPEPGVELTREVYRQAVITLRKTLPPPDEDTPEAWRDRDRTAIAKVASLVPGNPVEADLAALHVAAVARAAECLGQVDEYAGDVKTASRLRAQSACMGREARGYANALLRLQAVRLKREAKDDTREKAAWTEHSTFGLMSDALESLPAKPPAAAARAPAAVAGAASSSQAPAAARASKAPPPWQFLPPLDYKDWPEEEKRQDRLSARASRYAILNTERVKRMRQIGGLPDPCDFEPPDPELLQEILTGTHLDLIWADTYEPYVAPSP